MRRRSIQRRRRRPLLCVIVLVCLALCLLVQQRLQRQQRHYLSSTFAAAAGATTAAAAADGHDNKKREESDGAAGDDVCDAAAGTAEHDYDPPQPPSTPTSSTSNDDRQEEHRHRGSDKVREPRSIFDFFRTFRSLGTSWDHFMTIYRGAFSQAMGKDHRDDIWAPSIEEEGLVTLRKMLAVDQQQQHAGGDSVRRSSSSCHALWSERDARHAAAAIVPALYAAFNATTDDVLLAFLRWAVVDGTDDDVVTGEEGTRPGSGRNINNQAALSRGKVNVSKAWRKLTAYCDWMELHAVDLFVGGAGGGDDGNMQSIKQAWDVFKMRVTYDDAGRLVWWFDMGRIDLGQVHAMPPNAILRMFVWFAHLAMLDQRAQQRGIVVVDNLAQTSFGEFIHMMPTTDVGLQIDYYIIALWPLKKKLVLVVNSPHWFHIMYRVVGVFIPKKMKRLVEVAAGSVAPEVDDRAYERERKIIANRVGLDCIPTGFGGRRGEGEKDDYDWVAETYF